MLDPALGIDIGATKVCLALVSEDGEILRTTRYMVHEDPDIRRKLLSAIDAFLAGTAISTTGIGLKGLIASDLEHIISSTVLERVLPWDICAELSGRLGVPCRIDNDVHAATAAEIRFGAGREMSNFVYINVGTGLAAGIVVDGKLIRGASNLAGEIGLSLYEHDGVLSELEMVASGGGIGQEAQRLMRAFPDSKLCGRTAITGKDVAEALREGDSLAEAAWDNAAEALARLIFNLSVMLDTQAFLLGGGVVNDGRMFSEVRRRLELWMGRLHRLRMPEIRLSSLGADFAGVLGAAAVGFDAVTQSRT